MSSLPCNVDGGQASTRLFAVMVGRCRYPEEEAGNRSPGVIAPLFTSPYLITYTFRSNN